MCSNNYKWVDGEIATYAIWYECNVWLPPQNEWNWSCERCRKRVEWSNFSQAWMIQAVIYFNRMSEWVCVVTNFQVRVRCTSQIWNFLKMKKNRRDWEREEEKRILIYLTIRYIPLMNKSWDIHFFGNTLAPYHYTLYLYVYVIDFTSSKWQRLPNLLLLLLLLLAAVMRIVCVFMCFQSVSIPLSYSSGISVGVHRKTVDRPKKTINKWRWFLLHILPYEVLALKLLADLIYSLWMKFIKWIK